MYRADQPALFCDASGSPLFGAAGSFRPDGLERAAALCRALADGFPFLRVDVSFTQGKAIFAGLRFFEDWETLSAVPAHLDAELGSYLPVRRQSN